MKKMILLAAIAALMLTSCEKVSPQGVLMGNTSVDDRVKQSLTNYSFLDVALDKELPDSIEEYSFLVGSDSHITIDPGRLSEMLELGMDHDDLFYCHLGDLADTKAEYYYNTDRALDWFRTQWMKKYATLVADEGTADGVEYYVDKRTGDSGTWSEFRLPFYPVVGNHDITHNGWALWSNIFHSSFYDTGVMVLGKDGTIYIDHFIFLDTASGTLGKEQVNLIEQGVLDGKALEDEGFKIRNTFVFSHTNIFRPSSLQFASTFPREESFFLLNQFVEWDADIVFCGHVHKWDYQEVGGVHYITLDSMSEANNPEPGDYLVRVHVAPDGTYSWERVHMNK